MPSKLYCELRLMFGDFNEAAQPKTSLAKYLIESNDVAVQLRLHRIAYLKLMGLIFARIIFKIFANFRKTAKFAKILKTFEFAQIAKYNPPENQVF